jgi:hypothetical protein
MLPCELMRKELGMEFRGQFRTPSLAHSPILAAPQRSAASPIRRQALSRQLEGNDAFSAVQPESLDAPSGQSDVSIMRPFAYYYAT